MARHRNRLHPEMKRPAGGAPETLKERLMAGVDASDAGGANDRFARGIVERNAGLIDDGEGPLDSAGVRSRGKLPSGASGKLSGSGFHVFLGDVIDRAGPRFAGARSEQQIDALPGPHEIKLLL